MIAFLFIVPLLVPFSLLTCANSREGGMYFSWLSSLQLVELSLSIGLWLGLRERKEWPRHLEWLFTLSFSDWVYLFNFWSLKTFCRITLHAGMSMKAFRIWFRLRRRIWSFAGIHVVPFREQKLRMAERMLGNGPPDDLTISKGQSVIFLTTFPGQPHSMCILRVKLQGTFDLKTLSQWVDGKAIPSLDGAAVLEISYCPVLAGVVQMESPPFGASLNQ